MDGEGVKGKEWEGKKKNRKLRDGEKRRDRERCREELQEMKGRSEEIDGGIKNKKSSKI